MDKQEKASAKVNEKKNERAGTQQHIAVNVARDKTTNFHSALDEMRQICEMHGLAPHEVYALANQLKWQAIDVSQNVKMQQLHKNMEESINNMFNPKKSHEDREAEKKEKEQEEGKQRVKPGE